MWLHVVRWTPCARHRPSLTRHLHVRWPWLRPTAQLPFSLICHNSQCYPTSVDPHWDLVSARTPFGSFECHPAFSSPLVALAWKLHWSTAVIFRPSITPASPLPCEFGASFLPFFQTGLELASTDLHCSLPFIWWSSQLVITSLNFHISQRYHQPTIL